MPKCAIHPSMDIVTQNVESVKWKYIKTFNDSVRIKLL